MVKYIVSRIIEGIYTYNFVIGKIPDSKDEIDTELTAQGYSNLITQ